MSPRSGRLPGHFQLTREELVPLTSLETADRDDGVAHLRAFLSPARSWPEELLGALRARPRTAMSDACYLPWKNLYMVGCKAAAASKSWGDTGPKPSI
jgi:hypothetical protein